MPETLKEMLADMLARAGMDPAKGMPPFRPHVSYNAQLDLLIYCSRDCSYVTRPIPHTNMSLLIDKSNGHDEIVGVQIEGFRALAQGEMLILPDLTDEQKRFLREMSQGYMTAQELQECTCQIGGPKNPNRKPCPIHHR